MSYATLVPDGELNIINFTSISDVGNNTLRAHFVNSEISIFFPENNSQYRYRIPNYCENL